jgi:hypothetical protein
MITGIKNVSQSGVEDTKMIEETQPRQSPQHFQLNSTISSFLNSNRKINAYFKVSKKKSKHSTTSHESIASSDGLQQTCINEQYPS